jgi:serine/threonine protein kinase
MRVTTISAGRFARVEPTEMPTLPPPGHNNLWYYFAPGRYVLVFVHGVLSDSRTCWLEEPADGAPGQYWPDLVRTDPRLGDPAIFLGGYYTDVDSGPYEIRNCADELFEALRRKDLDGRPPVLDHDRLVFVCHSTGGVVARYLLDKHHHEFASKQVGLVLIASPSYGSSHADRLSWLTALYKHRLGKQLRWGNWTLKDLDSRFKDLVHDKRIPQLCGVEAYENHFIVHRRWLPALTYVVDELSAGRYFGSPRLLRQTDHFTAAKPDSHNHPSHELLVDFMTRQFTVRSTPGGHGMADVRRPPDPVPPSRPRGAGRASSPGNSRRSSDVEAIGTKVLQGEYADLATIHRGHYSVVRRGVRRATGETCVVKQTVESLVSMKALEALQALANPHIVTPREFWNSEGYLFEELPLIDGILLSDVIAPGIGGLRGDLLETCHDQLVTTLAALHEAGLVYRDVHPENLFLVVGPSKAPPPLWSDPESRSFLERFGHFPARDLPPAMNFSETWVLADSTFVAFEDEDNRAPVVHGAVTAPEQVTGRPSAASDMYALGATLYFGITGSHVPERTGGGEPMTSLVDGYHLHSSVGFVDYLEALLSSDPARRPLASDAGLTQNTVFPEYCATLRASQDRFILGGIGGVSRLVDATVLARFHSSRAQDEVSAHWLAIARQILQAGPETEGR